MIKYVLVALTCVCCAAFLSLVPHADASSVYVVRQGDTLWAIAGRLGVSVGQLASANHLSLTATIQPGERLVSPGRTGAYVSAGAPASRAAVSPVRVLRTLPSRGVAFTSSVVRTALRFLGRPYQWAGIGNRGFDCSGLVYRVYAMMRLSVPHSSFDQFREGVAVPRGALAPGDLVFFHTYSYGPSHVGIYVGGNQFIHASTDRGVIVSSLSESYYAYRYLGARRI
ncbi:MAG TPA: LysM peptidoglycan-binding domain-containing C40 family peptidase [bacterium]|nr:LysM peptidoglycan-binding domain-containing C40 family peptidase [bacterium]